MSKFADQKTLDKVKELGYFNDAQAGFSGSNIGMPAGILSQVSVSVVENILKYRAGDEALGGRTKVIDWAKQDYYIPFVEKLGAVTPYNDYDDAVSAGINLDFERTGHYRFSNNVVIGELEEMQLSEANVNAREFLTRASSEALMTELNRVAFNGYVNNNGKNLVYGLLNNPNLSAYNSAAKKFVDMTWQECVTFFATALAKIREQSGNNIQRGSDLRVIVSSKAFDSLNMKYTDMGINVLVEIKKTIEALGINLNIIPALELDSANAGQDVIYFIADNDLGGVTQTSTLGFSEIARMGNVVTGTSYTMQKMSAGTTGAIIYKPIYVVRYTNI